MQHWLGNFESFVSYEAFSDPRLEFPGRRQWNKFQWDVDPVRSGPRPRGTQGGGGGAT